jgi:UDP-2-acetamido-3-amino-2,3-dideoxy-glucuronate N-acetyltransferase
VPDCFVHETAIIDEGAEIGENCKIWHWTHVSAGARIGKNCSFGQNVYIANRVSIGNNVKVQNNVSIYDEVTLEDDVFCGPSMVFTNVYNPRAEIERKSEYRPTVVRQGATLGANCTIVCGSSIGRYAFVAAGTVVLEDIPDFALVAGVPARHKGWMSRSGARLELPLSGNGKAICPETGEKYRLVNGECFPDF